MTKFTLRNEQHKAEILRVLKWVMSYFWIRLSTDITDIFKAMFPDSAIAQKMRFGSNKLSFLMCFGIAAYFKKQLLVELKETQCFSSHLMSHLTMNFTKKQVDFFVKSFNKDRVVCRYLTSRFLGHTCADDPKKEFEEGIQELDMKKMGSSFHGWTHF